MVSHYTQPHSPAHSYLLTHSFHIFQAKMARGLTFGLSHHLCSIFVHASDKVLGKTGKVCISELWVLTGRISTKSSCAGSKFCRSEIYYVLLA